MFASENNHKNDLNLFHYKDHICLIKDLNRYLHRNNKNKNKKYFCSRCLNSFTSEENLDNHKNLCLKYNKKSEKLILPKENSILKFEKIQHMIKTPFTIYYDIETYNQHLKKTTQFKKIENTNHGKSLKNNIIINKNKCKGIKKPICLKHDEYKRVLYKEELIYTEFYNLKLKKQNICLDKINKIALNPFKSKRYWIDSINSLPYGYVE